MESEGVIVFNGEITLFVCPEWVRYGPFDCPIFGTRFLHPRVMRAVYPGHKEDYVGARTK